jgi:phosphoadenosine phosphosulfate reductase
MTNPKPMPKSAPIRISKLNLNNDQIDEVKAAAESWGPQQVLAWAFEKFGSDVAISSAFGAEGMVLIDMASRIRKEFRLFTMDTQFFFPETYSLMETVERRYGVTIERVYSQLSPEEQAGAHGAELWKRDPDLCCNLRKVQPLRQKLAELQAWITGIRRDQTAVRSSAGKIEWDAKFGLVKVNPIADWTEKQVWKYIYENSVPYNVLRDRGYPSIGCTHCTRAVLPGEDGRTGRWAGSEKTECGLHILEEPAPLDVADV